MRPDTGGASTTLHVAGSGLVTARVPLGLVALDGSFRLMWEVNGQSRGRDLGPEIARLDVSADGVVAVGAVVDPLPTEDCDVSLLWVEGESSQVLATTRISATAACVRSVHPDGGVSGWCVGAEQTGAELLVDGHRVATFVPNRFSPDLSFGGTLAFRDFYVSVPFALMATAGPNSEIAIRRLGDEQPLFSSPLRKLLVSDEADRAALPIDVIRSVPMDMVYDPVGVEAYRRRYGSARLVDALYEYVLERRADAGGRGQFVAELERGERNSRDLFDAMYNSEERKSRGALLGPLVGDPDYPFAAGHALWSSMRQGNAYADPHAIKIGQPRSLGGEMSRGILETGWGWPEEHWSWMVRRNAVARFHLENFAACSHLRLRCRSITLDRGSNHLAVSLNGFTLHSWQVTDSWVDLDCIVPAGVARAENELWLDAGSATNVPGDPRSLSICVEELELR